MIRNIVRSASKSPWEVLGMSPKSSKPEIKAKYYELAKKFHPDLHNGNATKFQEINNAYQKIMSGEASAPLSPDQKAQRTAEFNKKMQEKVRPTKRTPRVEIPDYRFYYSLVLIFCILYPLALYFEPKNQFNRPILVTEEEFERIMQEEEEEEALYYSNPPRR